MEKLPEQQKDNEVESPEKKKERIVPIDWWFKYGKTVNSESHNVGWEYDIIKKTPSVNENTALALAGEAKEILCKAFYSPSSLEYPVAGFINMMGNNMFAAKMYRSKYSTPSGHYWIQRNVAFISTEKFDELGGHVEALLQTKSFGDNKEVRIQEKYDPLDSLEVPVKEDKEYIADYLSFDENASVVLANFMRGLLGPKKMIVYVNYENARDYYLALYGAAISCLPLRARKDALFVLDAYDMFASEVKMVKINFCGSYYAERQGYYQEYKSKFSNFDVMSGTKAKLALQESKYVEKIMRGIEMMKKDPDAGYRVIQDIVNDPRLSEVKLDTLDKISSNYYKNEMDRLSEKKEEKISEIEKEEIDRLIGERMNLFRENTQLFLNSGYLKKKDETARLEGVRKGLDALEKIIGEEIAMRINENGNYKSAADVEKDMKEIIGSVALNHKEYSKQKFPQSDTFARIVNEINAPLTRRRCGRALRKKTSWCSTSRSSPQRCALFWRSGGRRRRPPADLRRTRVGSVVKPGLDAGVEGADARRDFLAEAGAVEDAIMSDVFLQMMHPQFIGDIDAQILRRLGLADAGNIVLLALDGHQPDPPDGAEIDGLAAMLHLAARQLVVNENGVDRLQVEFGGQVHHGEIFVVEFTMFFRRIAVALDQMIEHFQVGADMAVEIHRHEAGKLEEAWIDLAARARIGEGRDMDAVAPEPLRSALFGKLVHFGWAAPCVDRPSHEGH